MILMQMMMMMIMLMNKLSLDDADEMFILDDAVGAAEMRLFFCFFCVCDLMCDFILS